MLALFQNDSLTQDLLGKVATVDLLVPLALTLLLGQVLAWHYVRFANVLSNRRKFARMFVFLAATTFLVISIVSHSLALSLGLVGALSIVRFRTPIKEPEELAYLFLAIAIGLGMGAREPVITVVVVAVVLGYLTLQERVVGDPPGLRTVLQVQGPGVSGDPLASLMPVLSAHCARINLRRLDQADDAFQASLLVEMKDATAAMTLLERVREAVPGASVSLIERDTLE